MITANCRVCGKSLLPGQRTDAVFCCSACRQAAHRARHGGSFLGSYSNSDALIEILKIPVAGQGPSPEAIKNRLRRAERELAEAKAAVEKLSINVREPEPKMMSAWEAEKAAQAERGPRPKTAYQVEMAARRSGTWSEPTQEPEEVAVRFNNADAEGRAKMICEAAAKGVRLPKGK
jgi:hypothetical protein